MIPVARNADGSVTVAVDRKLFSRDAVKRAAVALVERCFVVLDLDAEGAPLVTLRPFDGGEGDSARRLAGELGNLLVADLAARKLDPQARAARNLLVARALDGALPKGPPGDAAGDGQPPPEPPAGGGGEER